MSSTFSGDETAPFFGFLGAAAALVFSCKTSPPIFLSISLFFHFKFLSLSLSLSSFLPFFSLTVLQAWELRTGRRRAAWELRRWELCGRSSS